MPRLTQGWPEPLPAMLHKTVASSLYAMPAVDKLPHAMHDHGIVYLGDAWHPMSPIAGAGQPCTIPTPGTSFEINNQIKQVWMT